MNQVFNIFENSKKNMFKLRINDKINKNIK